MSSILEPFEVLGSTVLHVRLRTYDGELPVNVAVERSAIDNHFQLSRSLAEFRQKIVQVNLAAITAIASEHHRRRMWTEHEGIRGRYREIVLRKQDLRGAQLQLPD